MAWAEEDRPVRRPRRASCAPAQHAARAEGLQDRMRAEGPRSLSPGHRRGQPGNVCGPIPARYSGAHLLVPHRVSEPMSDHVPLSDDSFDPPPPPEERPERHTHTNPSPAPPAWTNAPESTEP